MPAFIHNNADGFRKCTFAIEVPKRKILERMVETNDNGLMLRIGIAYAHPNYQFIKREGRRVAEEKMALKMAFLQEVKTQEDGRKVYQFAFDAVSPTKDQKPMSVLLGFSTKEGSENVHTEYAFTTDRF